MDLDSISGILHKGGQFYTVQIKPIYSGCLLQRMGDSI